MALTTWDPAKKDASISLSGGNLIATGSAAAFRSVLGTLSHSSTGDYYFEGLVGGTIGSFDLFGLGDALTTLNNFIGLDNHSIGWCRDGRVLVNNTNLGSVATWTSGDVLSVAVSLASGKIWFRKNNGDWNNDILANQNPATGAGGRSLSGLSGGPYFPGYTPNSNGSSITANFGASAFAQSVPSGFIGWGTASPTSRAMLIG